MIMLKVVNFCANKCMTVARVWHKEPKRGLACRLIADASSKKDTPDVHR